MVITMSFDHTVRHRVFPRYFKFSALLFLAFSVLVAITCAGWLLEKHHFHLREIVVSQYLTQVDNPLLDVLSLAAAYGFATVPALVLTVVISTWLSWRGNHLVFHPDLPGFQPSRLENWQLGAHFAAITLSGWAGAAVIKPLVTRERPDPLLLDFPLAPKGGFLSFPSGHTAFATGLFLAFALVVVPVKWRTLSVILALLGGAAVGFTRVYVGAHFVTDAVAGLFAGCAGVVIYLIFSRIFQEKRKHVPNV